MLGGAAAMLGVLLAMSMLATATEPVPIAIATCLDGDRGLLRKWHSSRRLHQNGNACHPLQLETRMRGRGLGLVNVALDEAVVTRVLMNDMDAN